eukprot:TRINITY_DN22433_c0_g1_i1.p1 TRINITY_DN22433_c0_g1~~TRINITY_DN22433_c0_g1_i1.p1  ORF type:complete len:213 (-),score=51.10 TRINITY_DN22433_c0_g1_i1:183-821(-)
MEAGKDGFYVGSYKLGGTKEEASLQLRFRSGVVTGQDAATNQSIADGTYMQRPPFNVSFKLNGVTFEGFLTRSEIFGECSRGGAVPKGNFHFKFDNEAGKALAEELRQQSLARLLELGYEPDVCSMALAESNGTVDGAVAWIQEQHRHAQGREGTEASGAGGQAGGDHAAAGGEEAKEMELMAICGCSQEEARHTLQACGYDVQTAVELLLQ